jgi:lipopolysaccharide transport system ATP-binding protein
MGDIAIRSDKIGKLYRIGSGLGVPSDGIYYRTLRETIAEKISSPLRGLTRKGQSPELRPEGGVQPDRVDQEHTIWALRDITFELKKGQVLGVIGRNGAGKSTLLKILSRVTEPTEGTAEIHGRVGSLLEVGTGFHPELTGRENIYLNGAILGMKRAEIDTKFDEIVDFAEVEKFIDTPVKRYSSGMYLRLAFAVAAHLEPEILVVDEVLAVGDAEFQRKCLGKMSNVAEQGRTVLFVSHNMSAIMRLTEETIVLDKGKLVLRAPTSQAVDFYMSSGFSQVGERIWQSEEIPDLSAPFKPIKLSVKDNKGRIQDTIRSTNSCSFEIQYQLQAPITGLRVGIYLLTSRGEHIFTSFDTDDNIDFENHRIRQPGFYTSRCVIPPDFFNEGRYIIGINASSYRIKRYFQDEYALTFTVDAAGAPGTHWPETRFGMIRPRLDWIIEKDSKSEIQYGQVGSGMVERDNPGEARL